MSQQDPNRRQFNQWTLAALGGAVAGSIAGCSQPEPDSKPAETDEKPTEDTDVSATETSAEEEWPTEIDGDPVDVKLLLSEKHICRGLNMCKGKGADGMNECAGQGTCATVEHHGCGGDHDCKGLSGCGQTAGINMCKNMGGCGVPVHQGAWETARERFEKLLAAQGKTFGPAPAKMEE